jgi:hypothetical protein
VFKNILRVLIAISFLAASALPASAASYRYWGFFTGADGAWTMAMVGAAENIPADGSVDGWRFGIGTDTDTPEPRTMPNFAELCPDLIPAEGITRVAVVIDFGDADQAPAAEAPRPNRVECVSMPAGGSSADALAISADVRANSGFVCGIDGYPLTECGTEVPDVAEAEATPYETTAEAVEQAAEEMDTGGNIFIYAGIILVVVVGVVLFIGRTKK